MKSEERHQLLTNDLGVVTERTVGFFEQHLPTMISVICGLLLAVGIGFWWTRSSVSESAAGWTMLDSAQNLEEFGTVVDKFKGKPPGQWAQLQISEKTLQAAIPLMFTNRDIALADLKRSREGFESLLQEKSVSPTIRERALWGLALTLETLCDGDTSKAIEAYERLIADFPDGIFKAVAADRIAGLKKSDAKAFYTWFSKETPKPPEARPRDFTSDSIHLPAPSDPKDSPDDFESDLKIKPQAPADPKNESDEKSKVDEKPDAEKSAPQEKPAETEKPATTEPPKDGDKN